MGKGFSSIEILDAVLPEVKHAPRRRQIGDQFNSWSIDHVHDVLQKFDAYRSWLRFRGYESVRKDLLTQWPELYRVLDEKTAEIEADELALARSRRHPASMPYAMRKDPNARPPTPRDPNDDDDSEEELNDGSGNDNGEGSDMSDAFIEEEDDEDEEDDSDEDSLDSEESESDEGEKKTDGEGKNDDERKREKKEEEEEEGQPKEKQGERRTRTEGRGWKY